MHHLLTFIILITLFQITQAQSWTLKDMGVGLVVEDDKYDTELKIMERGTVWDIKELYENGALSGKYKGNQRFMAWISGSLMQHSTDYWKYTITFPDGKKSENGPYGFYSAGHGTFAIPAAGYKDGLWKIDFFIWNKETKESRHVGTVQFTTTYGKPTNKEWSLIDAGIGIIDQTAYDSKLLILQRGDTWSQKELYEKGYFAGRDKVFATWLVGPPTASYLNENGVPIYLYKIMITYPNSTIQEFGPYNFYAPGFSTMFINASGNMIGTWKIDYYLIQRDTKITTHIKQLSFVLTE